MDSAGRCASCCALVAAAVLAAAFLAACRATEVKPTSLAPKPTPSRQAEKRSSPVAYPEVLRGTWMPKRMGCVPADGQGRYQGEDLLYIGADMLGQYENTSKPLRVEKTAARPPAWIVLTAFSTGTGEYDGKEIVTFTLREGQLSIKTGDATTVYVRCDYKID